MKLQKGDPEFDSHKKLFCQCFGENDTLAEEILGFARDYGEIHNLVEDGNIVTMLCLAELDMGIKYLFAVATRPNYRKKGLFAKNLSLSINSDEKIVCIPENEMLFPLYNKLGFTNHGYILQSNIIGDGSLNLKRRDNVNLEQLYEIYKSSTFYPKKPKELFISTVKCHLLYNGSIISDGKFYALVNKTNGINNIYELCVPASDEKRIPQLIKSCFVGKTNVKLATNYALLLKENGIAFRKRKIYALKSAKDIKNDFYINILYN